MFSRLRENLSLKLLALAFAVSLHLYVTGQQNPHATRTLYPPLDVQNVPPGLLLTSGLPQVSVTLDGPPDALDQITKAGVRATLDLGRGHAGRNAPARISVEPPIGSTGEEVAMETSPSAVAVTLSPLLRRRLPVTASDPGAPPVGYRFSVRVTPTRATVSGAEEAVRAVAYLAARADPGGGSADDDLPLVPLDVRGAEVPGVAVAPPTAHVRVSLVRVPTTRTFVVSYNLTGNPAYPYKIMDVQVSPPTVRVTGQPGRLAQVTTIPTTPVDVSGATGDVTRQAACTPPSGLKLVGPASVTVAVHIAAPPAAPPGAPAQAGPARGH